MQHRWNYIFRISLFSVLLLCVCSLATSAQEQESVARIVKGDANACELNSAYLDALTQDARASSERIFVIARLGKRESSRTLNRRRLHRTRNHLVTSGRLAKGSVIFAEGDQAETKGRLEFYLGSKLYLVSLVEYGKDVCLTCCDDRASPSR